MARQVIDTLKLWAAPLLAAAVLTLATYVWSMQAQEIANLKEQLSTAQIGLSVIQANQADRKEVSDQFYAATSQRLDKLEEILGTVGNSLARLTALQERAR